MVKEFHTEEYLRNNLLRLAKTLGVKDYIMERKVWENRDCVMLTCITDSFEQTHWTERDGRDIDWQEYFPLPQHLDEIEDFAENTNIECNYFYGLTEYDSFGDCCLSIVLYFEKVDSYYFDTTVRHHQRRYDKVRKQLIGKGE